MEGKPVCNHRRDDVRGSTRRGVRSGGESVAPDAGSRKGEDRAACRCPSGRIPGTGIRVSGRQGAEKEAEMQKFVSGATQILVATTVIEVGVNVPNATVMVINIQKNHLEQVIIRIF